MIFENNKCRKIKKLTNHNRPCDWKQGCGNIRGLGDDFYKRVTDHFQATRFILCQQNILVQLAKSKLIKTIYFQNLTRLNGKGYLMRICRVISKHWHNKDCVIRKKKLKNKRAWWCHRKRKVVSEAEHTVWKITKAKFYMWNNVHWWIVQNIPVDCPIEMKYKVCQSTV